MAQADPIHMYKVQQQRASLLQGEAVDVQPAQTDYRAGRRPSRQAQMLAEEESPPVSPATLKRRNSKELQAKIDGGDVYSVLGIQKDEDLMEMEAKKRNTLEKAALKFLALLGPKGPSPAEESRTRWRSVAKLFRQKKLTLAHWEAVESGTLHSRRNSRELPAPGLVGPVTVRSHLEPEYAEFSVVSTVPGAKGCVATRWSHQDDYLACAYFDGCVTVFDADSGTAVCTQDVGCLKQMPSGEWRITQVDDDSVAVTNLRWGTAANSSFLSATATGGIVVLYEVCYARQRLAMCTRVQDELYGLDWTCDGSFVLTAGREKQLRLFDPRADLKPVVTAWAPSTDEGRVQGHANRISAVKAHPADPALVFTAGLDQTVQVWDIRTPKHVGTCNGAVVDGDALDSDQAGRFLVTAGSNHAGAHLDMWDLRDLRHAYSALSLPSTKPTSVGFTQDGKHIHVCGSGAPAAYVFATPHCTETKLEADVQCLAQVSAVDVSRCLETAHRSGAVAYGGNDGTVTIAEFQL